MKKVMSVAEENKAGGGASVTLHNLRLYEVGRSSILQMETVRLTEVK